MSTVANLRWHKESAAKTYPGTFFIVNSNELFVVFGRPAFPNCQEREINALFLQQQTSGMSYKNEALSIANCKPAKMNDNDKSKNGKESKISEQLKRKFKTRRWRKNEVAMPRAKQETMLRTNKGTVLVISD
ncbi:MAG: hypothetical protein Q9167_003879 [Letrouitia subvulpina]